MGVEVDVSDLKAAESRRACLPRLILKLQSIQITKDARDGRAVIAKPGEAGT